MTCRRCSGALTGGACLRCVARVRAQLQAETPEGYVARLLAATVDKITRAGRESSAPKGRHA